MFLVTGDTPPPASPYLGASLFALMGWGYSQRKNPPGGLSGLLAILGASVAHHFIRKLIVIVSCGPLCLAGMFAGAALEQLVVNKPHVPTTGFLLGLLAGFVAALAVINKVRPDESSG